MISIFLIIISIVSICYGATLHVKFRNSMNRMNNMMDEAIDGRLVGNVYDESAVSALENKMNKFLVINRELKNRINEEKDKIHELISDISHQTKTPIANIMMYSQLIEECMSEDDGSKEMIKIVTNESEKLDFLIESLMKTSRLESGIIQVRPERNNLEECIKDVCLKAQIIAEKKGIKFRYKTMKIEGIFDPKWTEEAVFNIIHNAIKYTKGGGKVDVSMKKYDMFCRVDIKDNGIGIEEKEQSKIFKRFFRSQNVSQEEGVGIGLFLSRNIILQQNGYIKVDSRLNFGSKFSIFIPR